MALYIHVYNIVCTYIYFSDYKNAINVNIPNEYLYIEKLGKVKYLYMTQSILSIYNALISQIAYLSQFARMNTWKQQDYI